MKNPWSINAKLFLLTSCIVSYNHSAAQTKQAALVKGTEISSYMKPGEKHRYSLIMNAKQFSLVNLNQKGIDLAIVTYDPDGKKMGEFDSPNGMFGPEPVTLVSQKQGTYILEVKPIDDKEKGGAYTIVLVRTEPVGITPEKQVDQLFAPWDNIEKAGAAVAVVKDDKIIYKKGYGCANLEYNIPITPSTVFHIASVSKQFTAFSVLLLEKEGKLSLDDDVRKYIPEVPDFGKVITLRQLAHHTSGLRDQWNLLAMAGWRLDDVITREHILKLVSRQKELNFNPGDEHLYCNTGFTLLAEVVARVSGKSFAEFTRELIFSPLRMNNTLFYDDHEKIVKNRAYSYQPGTDRYKKSVLNYANVGATSLFTTAEDLCLWAINFDKPVVGDINIINEMNTRGVLNKGDTISYALGQDIGKYRGLKIIAHGGADAGYRSFLVRFPDQKFAVAVLSNDAAFNPAGIGLKIADIYLKDKLKPQEVRRENVPPPSAGADDKTITVNIDTLKSYCGQYEVEPGINVVVSLEDRNLYGQAPGRPRVLLTPVSSKEFLIKGTDGRITFTRDDKGKISMAKIFLEGQDMTAPRIKDFDPGSINLKEFEGTYYSPELETFYNFTVEGGKLTAKHQRLSDFTLTLVSPDNFTGSQWFFAKVQFIRDAQNSLVGCRVSSDRVRNLMFEKLKTD